jgi:hypothetical protein
MVRKRVVELSSWLIKPETRPQVIVIPSLASPSFQSPKRKTMSSPRNKKNSPRTKKPTAPTPLEKLATSIAVCHQINSLFRAQSSFVEAEFLANEFYKHTAVTTATTKKNQIQKVALLEALLDIMEASGNMAHVPLEVLANFALDANYKKVILQSEAVDMTRAMLLALERTPDGKAEEDNSALLLKSIAQDFIEDLEPG